MTNIKDALNLCQFKLKMQDNCTTFTSLEAKYIHLTHMIPILIRTAIKKSFLDILTDPVFWMIIKNHTHNFFM